MNKKQLREAKRAEKEKAQGSDVRPAANVRTAVVGNRPDILADAISMVFRIECPCGLGAEPWHWPRNGICSVGAAKKVSNPEGEGVAR